MLVPSPIYIIRVDCYRLRLVSKLKVVTLDVMTYAQYLQAAAIKCCDDPDSEERDHTDSGQSLASQCVEEFK